MNKKIKILIGIILLMVIVDIGRYVPTYSDMMFKEHWGWPANPVEATYADLQYGIYDEKPLLLDIYLPDGKKSEEEPYPLIVFVHGGGWAVGDKELIEPGVFTLLDEGYAVASIGYTLSGEAQWPVQGQEVKGAVRWLRAHADEYTLDSDKFVAFGGSAGGHLSAFLGTTNGVSEFDSDKYGNLSYSSDVQASIALYPVNDLLQKQPFSIINATVGHHNAKHSGISKFLGGRLSEKPELAYNASPINYVSKETTAPMFLLHGKPDVVVPVQQSRSMYEVLQEKGIYSKYHEFKNFGHVDIGFADEDVMNEISAFISSVFQEN